MAIDEVGNLYVADAVAGSVTVRDEQGRLLAVKTHLGRPSALAVDRGGSILVGDEASGSVSVFDPTFAWRGKLGRGDGEFLRPAAIAIAYDGRDERVWVADADTGDVKVFVNGVLRGRLPDGSAREPGFVEPGGLLLTPAGELFVVDRAAQRVQVFDVAGRLLRSFGHERPATTRAGRSVAGIALDGGGRLYVAAVGQTRLDVYDARRGTYLGALPLRPAGLEEIEPIGAFGVDRNSRLFVAGEAQHRIDVIGVDGFADPLAPVQLHAPATLSRRPSSEPVTLQLEVVGFGPDAIDPASVTADGLEALPEPVVFEDSDRDGLPEARLSFAHDDLLLRLPDGESLLGVNGSLRDGTWFEARAFVVVEPETADAEADPGY